MNQKFKAGIVSVTFRQYAYKNLIKYIKQTDLSCVEWGSDIHVPYDNPEKAADVNAEMSANNLITSSYGSYYRLGQPHESGLFSMILNTAEIISAPMIRVWGGAKSGGDMTSEERSAVIADCADIAEQAKKNNIKISLEYHGGTITDTADSALDFIKDVRTLGGENVYLYWQPNQNVDFKENRLNLMKICPYLSNIHVFAWDKAVRLPLSEHQNIWKEYANIVKNCTDTCHDFLLEFVKGDSAEQFIEDAKVLTELLEHLY